MRMLNEESYKLCKSEKCVNIQRFMKKDKNLVLFVFWLFYLQASILLQAWIHLNVNKYTFGFIIETHKMTILYLYVLNKAAKNR